MNHYVYILRCSDNSLYTGYTTNLDRRLVVHNSGKGAKYTRSRLPVRLVYYEEVSTRSEGLKLERSIKKLTKEKKEDLVAGFDLGK
ncbi:GIY-YIG nuclease family protein [uncultured Anaerococcus sp.]|uniref:GIY-YIG nuclease family protein n=1 Tax=uncultured Anaerococcus sp. TaxID=293428 RepID=UPI00288AB619|nr:GIY-YIG nuclease family protein [uncultured Anaerococcus sp.]